MLKPPFALSKEQHDRFAGIYLLRKMVTDEPAIDVTLPNDYSFLDETLTWLMGQDWVEINRKTGVYAVSAKGLECLKKFQARYHEYLQVFDVYFAVDTAAGEFAFASKLALAKQQWKVFLQQERWVDLRVAVAEFKNMDPLEVVFMSRLNEGLFGQGERGWQFNLKLGSVFDEIVKICNSAYHVHDLGEDEESAVGVMTEIINQGSQLMVNLLEEERRMLAEQQAAEAARTPQQTQQEVVETRVVTEEIVTYQTVIEPVYYPTSYYYGYTYDPFYVSPVWVSPWWY